MAETRSYQPPVRHNASAFRRLVDQVELRKTGTGEYSSVLTNEDLLPVPYEKRTWTKWTYTLFWFGECASVTSWTVAATGVQQGLSWWESWICVILGHFIVGIPMVMTGRPGATYHVPFPVITRASFGIWGAYWPIFNRNAMTIIWTGVQGVTTGNCIYVMLHAIFPSIARVPNPFSKDVTMTGGRLIGYSLGWIICICLAFVRPQRLTKLIYIKSIIMMICLFTFFGWSLSKAHGIGPIIHAGAAIPAGQSHAWVFLKNLFVQAGNMATFATNNADITRYSKRPNNMLWTQVWGMPVAFGVVAFFGVFVTSSSRVIFGKVIWDPMQILDGFLQQDYDSSSRAGVFFIALGFSFAQCTTMIFANIIAAGNDTAAMWPRFINYRRGAIICLTLAFAITPWNLMKTSFTFTSYLGSYQIFLANIIGVIIGDYFLVRRGKMDLQSMFSAERGAHYYYNFGWNWRAYGAYLAGMVPAFPGFLSSVGVKGVPLEAQRLFIFALPIGIVVSALVYWGLSVLSPPMGGLVEGWQEPRVEELLDGLSEDSKSKDEVSPKTAEAGVEKV